MSPAWTAKPVGGRLPYLELETLVQIHTALPHGNPIRRQRVIAGVLPIVEDLMHNLGDVLSSCVVGAIVGCLGVGLRNREAGVFEEDLPEEEQP
jgi:hypothetical protein